MVARLPTWLRIAARLLLPIVVSAIVVPQLPRFRDATIELQKISATRLTMGCRARSGAANIAAAVPVTPEGSA